MKIELLKVRSAALMTPTAIAPPEAAELFEKVEPSIMPPASRYTAPPCSDVLDIKSVLYIDALPLNLMAPPVGAVPETPAELLFSNSEFLTVKVPLPYIAPPSPPEVEASVSLTLLPTNSELSIVKLPWLSIAPPCVTALLPSKREPLMFVTVLIAA